MNVIEVIFGKTHKTRITVIISLFIGLTLLSINFIYFSQISHIFTTLNIVSALIILGPSLTLRYIEYLHTKRLESRFPDWLRDVCEGVYSGMTLPQAIKNTKKNNYDTLTPYVRKIATQIDWGVPFERILKDFGKKSGSRLIRRAVSTIIETHRSGGNIADVLDAVVKSLIEVEKIKKERAAHIYSQMITGYMIFFVFLGVMIGMQKFLIPTLTVTGPAEMGLEVGGIERLTQIYKEMFRWLILIQGTFSGIAIGKMAEGSFIAGLKHSLVLCTIGYTTFTIFA
jgi:flagellar protein FlaJ